MTRKSGFTLIETMVATVLAGVVGMISMLMFSRGQQAAQATVERGAAHQHLMAGLRLTSEWRNLVLGGSANDIMVSGSQARYRAFRGLSRICALGSGAILISWDPRNLRLPAAGRDSLLLFVPGVLDVTSDDRWVLRAINSAPSGAVCPGGEAALRLGVSNLSPLLLNGLGSGYPVAWFEIMEWRAYRSAGSTWLGARSMSGGESIQPMLGPLRSPGLTGLAMTAGAFPAIPGVGGVLGFRLAVQSSPFSAIAGGYASHRTTADSVSLILSPRNSR